MDKIRPRTNSGEGQNPVKDRIPYFTKSSETKSGVVHNLLCHYPTMLANEINIKFDPKGLQGLHMLAPGVACWPKELLAGTRGHLLAPKLPASPEGCLLAQGPPASPRGCLLALEVACWHQGSPAGPRGCLLAPGVASWPQGVTCWPQGVTCWPQGVTCWPQGITCWLQGVTCWPQGVTCLPQRVTCWPQGSPAGRRGHLLVAGVTC